MLIISFLQNLLRDKIFLYNNLGIRAVIIYFTVQKVFKINLPLNIYPHNTLFYNNLGIFSVIIQITIQFHDVIKRLESTKIIKILIAMVHFSDKKLVKSGITGMRV